MPHSMQARLLGWRDIGPEVRHFDFDVPSLERFEFAPGQFVSLSGDRDGRKITRAYSIASPPKGNRFELCLNRVQEGVFSPHLFELEPGDVVQAKGPFGAFTLRTPVRDTLFVATGTGIAPFRSILRSRLPEDSENRFTLLLGVRFETGLLYREEFDQLERRHLNFRFLATLTRPENAWSGLRGRVQEHLTPALAGRRDVDVYICGLNEMVKDVRRQLGEMGFDRKQVLYERYD
ncbi:MAG: oxidoreductase [Acidobacteria bacterium]|nr:oxidoreductase [Acidobacteriota bacterium]